MLCSVGRFLTECPSAVPPGVHTILHSLIVFSAIIRQEVYLHVMIRDATLEIFAMTTLLESIEGLLLQGRFGIILRHPHLAVAVTLTITGEDRHQCLTGNVIRLRRLSSEDATHQTPRTVVMVDRLLCRLPLHPMIDMSEGRMTGMPPILFSTREGPELPLQGCETNMIESHLQPGRFFLCTLYSTLFLLNNHRDYEYRGRPSPPPPSRYPSDYSPRGSGVEPPVPPVRYRSAFTP